MTADELLPYLPHLRRFARLLTGDQVAGDWPLASLLQTLISTPGRLRSGVPARDRAADRNPRADPKPFQAEHVKAIVSQTLFLRS